MEDALSNGSFPHRAGSSSTSSRTQDAKSDENGNNFHQWSKVFRKQFEKTEMCRYYPQNKCKYGSKCAFAHHPDEIRRPPVLDKTAICRAWSEGTCTLTARECRFAHGRGELRFTDTVKTIMKKDRSIHPQKMSSVQQEPHGSSDLQSLAREGDDPRLGLRDIDSPSFTALIQELQSRVMSDMSRVVGKAGTLGPLPQEEPQYLHFPKASSPLASFAALEAQLAMATGDRPVGDRPIMPSVSGKGRRVDRQGFSAPVPKFCAFCGAPRGTDHLFCGDCGQQH
jgi:hypothetical protein